MGVTSPQLSLDEYLNKDMPFDKLVNAMVGDLQRVKEYPARGFQVRTGGNGGAPTPPRTADRP